MTRREPKIGLAGTTCVTPRDRARRHATRLLWLALFCALLSFSVLPPLSAQVIVDEVPLTTPNIIQPSSGGESSAKPGPGSQMFGKREQVDRAQPLYLQGDELVYDSRGRKVIARGNVEIFYNNHVLTADEVVYDQQANTLNAKGNVLLKDPQGVITRGERITLTDDFRDGFIQSLSVVARDDTRIAALTATRRDGNVTEFERGKFTPCKSDPGTAPLWCVSGRRIIHDQAEQTITYQDATFDVLGVPILYLPYFQHADPTVKRKSGFLFPEFGHSTDLGLMAETPYYFALSPHYDFTFHPLLTSRQGVLWKGEWRQRLAFAGINGQYSVKFAGIDQDAGSLPAAIPFANAQELDGLRGSVETRGRFSLSSWWQAGWDVIVESDDTFRRFYKLEKRLLTDRVNSAYVEGISDRNYLGVHLYHFGGLLVNDTSASESRVHPIVDYNYIFANPIFGGEMSFNVNALSFSQDLNFLDGNNIQQDVDSSTTRISADLNWRRRFIDPLGQTFTPFARLRGDVYQFNNVTDPTTNLLAPDDTVTRGIATGGLLYSYPLVAPAPGGSHVVEPVAQVVARTESVEQRRLPNEDARSLVFEDANLFEIDRTSGLDRVETGTRLNYGLQYTYQSFGGGFARFLVGQSYHASGENIYANPGVTAGGDRPLFNPTSGLETDWSDYVLGAYLAPNQYLQTIVQARFDQDTFDLRRMDAFARVNYGPASISTTYAYTAANPATSLLTDQQHIFSSASLRLTDRWSLIGQLRYDIEADQRLQDGIGLQYADECFVITTLFVENFIDDPNGLLPKDKIFLVRLQLKHLGEYRFKTDVLDFGGGGLGGD